LHQSFAIVTDIPPKKGAFAGLFCLEFQLEARGQNGPLGFALKIVRL
jgi:hypothetical protein